jgi:hypothetical protein
MLFVGEMDEKMHGAAQAIEALETLEGAFRDCSGGSATSAATAPATWTSCSAATWGGLACSRG